MATKEDDPDEFEVLRDPDEEPVEPEPEPEPEPEVVSGMTSQMEVDYTDLVDELSSIDRFVATEGLLGDVNTELRDVGLYRELVDKTDSVINKIESILTTILSHFGLGDIQHYNLDKDIRMSIQEELRDIHRLRKVVKRAIASLRVDEPSTALSYPARRLKSMMVDLHKIVKGIPHVFDKLFERHGVAAKDETRVLLEPQPEKGFAYVNPEPSLVEHTFADLGRSGGYMSGVGFSGTETPSLESIAPHPAPGTPPRTMSAQEVSEEGARRISTTRRKHPSVASADMRANMVSNAWQKTISEQFDARIAKFGKLRARPRGEEIKRWVREVLFQPIQAYNQENDTTFKPSEFAREAFFEGNDTLIAALQESDQRFDEWVRLNEPSQDPVVADHIPVSVDDMKKFMIQVARQLSLRDYQAGEWKSIFTKRFRDFFLSPESYGAKVPALKIPKSFSREKRKELTAYWGGLRNLKEDPGDEKVGEPQPKPQPAKRASPRLLKLQYDEERYQRYRTTADKMAAFLRTASEDDPEFNQKVRWGLQAEDMIRDKFPKKEQIRTLHDTYWSGTWQSFKLHNEIEALVAEIDSGSEGDSDWVRTYNSKAIEWNKLPAKDRMVGGKPKTYPPSELKVKAPIPQRKSKRLAGQRARSDWGMLELPSSSSARETASSDSVVVTKVKLQRGKPVVVGPEMDREKVREEHAEREARQRQADLEERLQMEANARLRPVKVEPLDDEKGSDNIHTTTSYSDSSITTDYMTDAHAPPRGRAHYKAYYVDTPTEDEKADAPRSRPAENLFQRVERVRRERAWADWKAQVIDPATRRAIDRGDEQMYFHYNGHLPIGQRIQPYYRRAQTRQRVYNRAGVVETHLLHPHPLQKLDEESTLSRLEKEQPLGHISSNAESASVGDYITLKLLPAILYIHVKKRVQRDALRILARQLVLHISRSPTRILLQRKQTGKFGYRVWLGSTALRVMSEEALYQKLLTVTHEGKKSVTLVVRQNIRKGNIHRLWERDHSLL